SLTVTSTASYSYSLQYQTPWEGPGPGPVHFYGTPAYRFTGFAMVGGLAVEALWSPVANVYVAGVAVEVLRSTTPATVTTASATGTAQGKGALAAVLGKIASLRGTAQGKGTAVPGGGNTLATAQGTAQGKGRLLGGYTL